MHSPRRHRALAKIAAIRDAERAVARHELVLANGREREAQADSRRADEATLAAATEWEEHLAGPFHPELARALGGNLMSRMEAGKAAAEHSQLMTEGREAREADWRLGDARCRQADSAFADSRRERAREREEHALEALADRTSYRWARA